MEQKQNLGDERLTGYCVYCGGPWETKDHAPSKVFLDEPFPENLPIVSACRRCNEGFSSDEEYVASLVECAVTGAGALSEIQRPKIRSVFEHSPRLAQRIWSARTEHEGAIAFVPEGDRVLTVVAKLARAHSAFELNLPMLAEPDRYWVGPLDSLTAEQVEAFESSPPLTLFPEAGCRALQRVQVVQVGGSAGFLFLDWVDVQEGRYRYYAREEAEFVLVRGVIGEYLGFELIWEG